jgi:transcriptional regulator with XRE-family HTH domain
MTQKVSRPNIHIPQLRAARALLGWTQSDLAVRSGLSLPTIKRLEGLESPAVSEDAKNRARGALEDAGIVFIQGNDGSLGVCLRKKRRG